MTDLQISLIAIGAVIIIGILIYNKWQENKTKKMVERAFSSLYDDVLMSDGKNENKTPHFQDDEVPVYQQDPEFKATPNVPNVEKRKKSIAEAYFQEEDIVVEEDAHTEPGLEGELQADQEDPSFEEAPVKRKPRTLPVDEIIDCRIPIALDTAVHGDKIIPIAQSLRAVGNKAVNFIGCTENSDWEAIEYGKTYTALIAGVQLANRASALNEIEYSELVTKLRTIADALGGEPDIPDMRDVMGEAQEMYQFIADHDAQLGINVRAKSGQWDVKTLVAALTRQGFDRYTDGYLMMQDGDGEPLFSLSLNAQPTAETTNCLTFLLDVPRIGAARNGYGAMVSCAKAISSRLNGVIVDDSGQPLSDEILNDIEDQVNAFYSAMESAGILAGSKRAQRLFS